MTFDARLTELIALGAATAANCTACLEHHVGKAREIGLPAEEVAAALEVGRRVRQGAAGALDRVAGRLGIGASSGASSAAATAAGCAPTPRAARACCG
jgi:AhpD family alkylhydroperoxidase